MDLLLSIILQITETASTVVENAPSEIRLSFLELYMKGGMIMHPIVILSLIAVYIFIERYLTITKASKIDKNFMNQIRDLVTTGKIDSAKDLCEKTDNPMARLVQKGISKLGKSLQNIDVSIENVGQLEIYKLEKSVAVLATIAGVAPMLGFLGTVLGMVDSFYAMSMAGNNITPGLLADGIYTALLTTVAGLLVGIPAYVGYNMLVTLIEQVIYKMEATTMEFIDIIQEPA